MSSPHQDRRKHQRVKIRVPIEFHQQGSRILRSATADLSPGGCYLETLFTFPVGTILEVTLRVGCTVHAKAIVVSRELQVGNGIQFIDMAPTDRDAIRNYMENAIKQTLSDNKHQE